MRINIHTRVNKFFISIFCVMCLRRTCLRHLVKLICTDLTEKKLSSSEKVFLHPPIALSLITRHWIVGIFKHFSRYELSIFTGTGMTCTGGLSFITIAHFIHIYRNFFLLSYFYHLKMAFRNEKNKYRCLFVWKK